MKTKNYCPECEHCNRMKGGFKKGDILLCMDERKSRGYIAQLHAGEIYVVTDGSANSMFGGVRVENPLLGDHGNMRWMKERFIKIGEL